MKKLLIFILSLIFLTGLSEYSHAAKKPVTVMSYAGDVRITPAGAVIEVKCEPGMLLGMGDRVKTGPESYIEMALGRTKDNIIRIEEYSDVIIKLDGPEKIELIDGTIFLLLRDLKRGETFRVRTPCGVCGARGTGWRAITNGIMMNVAVFQKKVFSRGIKKDGSVMEDDFWIGEGFMRTVKKFNKPGKLTPIPPEELAEMKKKFGLGKKSKMKDKNELIERMKKMDEKRTKGLLDKKNGDRLDKMQRKDKKSSGEIPYP